MKKNKAGMTYQDILDRYKEIYGIELKNAYVYLMRLKKKGIIKSYPTVDKKGKGFTYKLLEQREKSIDNIENIRLFKFMNDFFKDNVDVLFENERIKNFVFNHDKDFDKI